MHLPHQAYVTDRYCVFGNPIAHSRSPQIHALFALQKKQSLTYDKRFVDIGGFSNAVTEFVAEGGRGANVTVPFKLEALALAGHRTARAETAGAANTLSFVAGAIHADNTDGTGLVRDLGSNLGFKLQGASILILGAGGAARGVMGELLAERPARIVLANRTLAKAEDIAARFARAGQVEATALDAIPHQPFDLVLNATSSGLTGEAIPLPRAIFTRDTLAYDMVYGKPTAFLQAARQAGAQTADGLGMLVEQAAESFFIWRGVRPNTAPVIAQIRREVDTPV